jgi:hypothetical protein
LSFLEHGGITFEDLYDLNIDDWLRQQYLDNNIALLFHAAPASLDDAFPTPFSDSEYPEAIQTTDNLCPRDETMFSLGSLSCIDSSLDLSFVKFPGSPRGDKLNIVMPTPDPESGHSPAVRMDTPPSNPECLSPSKSMGVFRKLPLE